MPSHLSIASCAFASSSSKRRQLLLVIVRRHQRFLILQRIDLVFDVFLLRDQLPLRRIGHHRRSRPELQQRKRRGVLLIVHLRMLGRQPLLLGVELRRSSSRAYWKASSAEMVSFLSISAAGSRSASTQ